MAGGSQIIINGDGIKIITPREFKLHATQHVFKGGQTVENNVRQFLEPHSHQIQLLDDNGKPLGKNIPYYIFDKDSKIEVYGRTNFEGKTNRVFSKDQSQLTVKIGKEAVDFLLEKGIKI